MRDDRIKRLVQGVFVSLMHQYKTYRNVDINLLYLPPSRYWYMFGAPAPGGSDDAPAGELRE